MKPKRMRGLLTEFAMEHEVEATWLESGRYVQICTAKADDREE